MEKEMPFRASNAKERVENLRNIAFSNRSLSLLSAPALLPDEPVTQFSPLSIFPCQKTAPVVPGFGCKHARFGHGFWRFVQFSCLN